MGAGEDLQVGKTCIQEFQGNVDANLGSEDREMAEGDILAVFTQGDVRDGDPWGMPVLVAGWFSVNADGPPFT